MGGDGRKKALRERGKKHNLKGTLKKKRKGRIHIQRSNPIRAKRKENYVAMQRRKNIKKKRNEKVDEGGEQTFKSLRGWNQLFG